MNPGDWVSIPARVVEPKSGKHPEDVRVLLESHSEQFYVDVRKDRVTPIEPPIWVTRCTALYDPTGYGDALIRCTLPEHAVGEHEGAQRTWGEAAVYGWIEPA